MEIQTGRWSLRIKGLLRLQFKTVFGQSMRPKNGPVEDMGQGFGTLGGGSKKYHISAFETMWWPI
eukprot:10121316-Ditylum_brightwellii.AAC.1